MSRALLVALALAGCAPQLTAQSAAPPARSARLDEVTGFWGNIKSYRMEVSAGVALAVHCYRGGPCERLRVVSDDPAIAEVRAASIGRLERSGLANQTTASGFVVVGKAPGKTTLRLTAAEGRRTIAVTVVPPPQPSPPATVAH